MGCSPRPPWPPLPSSTWLPPTLPSHPSSAAFQSLPLPLLLPPLLRRPLKTRYSSISMVGYPSYGLDSHYFSTKQSKQIKSSPIMDSRSSPKNGKVQSRPFNHHNNSNSQNFNSTNSSQNY